MDDAKTFDWCAVDPDPALLRLTRTWAATWIRHQLFIGMRARSISATCEACGAATITALPDRQVSFTMLDLTGEGVSIEAALRHWCQQAEERIAG